MFAFVWIVWQERNERIFNNCCKSSLYLFNSFIFFLSPFGQVILRSLLKESFLCLSWRIVLRILWDPLLVVALLLWMLSLLIRLLLLALLMVVFLSHRLCYLLIRGEGIGPWVSLRWVMLHQLIVLSLLFLDIGLFWEVMALAVVLFCGYRCSLFVS